MWRSGRYGHDLEGLVSLVRDAEKLVVLSGAGISTASGLQDFRSKGGLWADTDPMRECSLSAFRRDPARFWRFYRDRLAVAEGVKPNPAHHAVRDLEKMGKLRWILTQNIDGLHQQAGSTRVAELHGSPRTVSCLACGFRTSWDEAMQLSDTDGIPCCEHGHPLKPDVVLFEEQLPDKPFAQAHNALAAADTLLCLGTSLVVHPVASFPEMMRRGGGKVAILTGSSTPLDHLAEVKMTDPLHELLPALVNALGS